MKTRITMIVALLVCVAAHMQAQYSAVNSVLVLNGSSYMTVPNHVALGRNLASGGRMSVDAWVYPTSITGLHTVLGHGYLTSYWFGLVQGNKVVFRPNPSEQYQSNASIPLNTWTHIAATYDVNSASAKIYINGVLDNTGTFLQGYIAAGSSDLRIGADRSATGGNAYFFNGRVDEVRLWDIAIDFSTASGLLYKVPHGVVNGRWGRFLVAGWRLNNSTSDITGLHNGTLAGGATFAANPDPPHYTNIGAVMANRSGKTGTQDYFVIRHSASLSLVQNYTLECWVKPSSSDGDPQYQTFIEKGFKATSDYTYWLGLNKSNNKVYFVGEGNFANGLESKSALPMGQWSHVAARFRRTGSTYEASIFINGLKQATQTYSSAATPNAQAVYIGRSDGPNAIGNQYGYSGIIDEVRIWGTARTDDQISDNYRLRYNGPQSGLNAVYRFDGDILDYSGNANNGDHTLDIYSDVYFETTENMPPEPTVRLVAPNGGETLSVGQVYKIRWQSTGLNNVSLHISRDNGGTYTPIVASTNANTGEYDWTVTGPETPRALVRVTTPSATGIADESDKIFTIAPSPHLEVTPAAFAFAASLNGPLPPAEALQATNTGAGNISWTATWTNVSWLNVSPVTDGGNFTNVSVSIVNTGLPEGVYTDTIVFTGNMDNSPVRVPVEYTLTSKALLNVAGVISNAPGTAIPVSMQNIMVRATGPVTKTTMTNAMGEFEIENLPEGNYIIQPDDDYLVFVPSQRSYTPLQNNVTDADFIARPASGSMTLQYEEGWNLLSIPLEMTETALTTLIPDAVPPAYRYDQQSGYLIVHDLIFGPGYWVKCSRAGSVELAGLLKRSVEHNLRAINGGWNLVGTPSAVSDTTHIAQNPPMSIQAMYDFNNVAGYIPPYNGFIVPGRAYWVKTSTDGTAAFLPASEGSAMRGSALPLVPSAKHTRTPLAAP